MAEATGLEAALAAQVKDAALPGGEEEQMELIAQLPLLGEVMREGKVLTPGRPKGSMNRATKELAAYILGRHRHPVIAAAEICDMPVMDLAKALNCERLDAAKYQQSCREFVAKYTLQAMPQSVQVDLGTVGMLMLINQNAPRPGDGDVLSSHGLALQIQGVSESERQASDGGSSDGLAKPLTEQAKP